MPNEPDPCNPCDKTPRERVERLVKRAVRRLATDVMGAVVETMDDVPTDNNQVIADLACETIDNLDLDYAKKTVHYILGTKPN